MQEKLKQLELLATQLLARQQETTAENASLKARMRTLEDTVDKLKPIEAEARALREWKKSTQITLKRLSAKVEKEIAKNKEEEKEII